MGCQTPGVAERAPESFAADPPKAAFGKDQFNARCAPCHGANGKGAGPAAKQLGTTVPDITTYARRNGGKFPVELAWQKIDGRPTTFDIERSMPVWGRDYSIKGAEYDLEVQYQPESYVRGKILSLIDYIYRLQVK